jgi:hypothetical protein
LDAERNQYFVTSSGVKLELSHKNINVSLNTYITSEGSQKLFEAFWWVSEEVQFEDFNRGDRSWRWMLLVVIGAKAGDEGGVARSS